VDLVLKSLPLLENGIFNTIVVSLLVVAFSALLGVLLGTVLVYGPAPARWIVRGYADLVRGIPVLVLIFTVYYGLPPLGVNLGNYTAAILALTIFATAQVVDIARGAIQSIHFGQTEAGKAIGLGFWERMIYVIFPQAARRFLPPWINNVTDVVKGSALISLVGIVDLMLATQQVIGRTYVVMPFYLVACAIYFAINYSLTSLSRVLEARFAYIRE
jgi:polar amino acid transport system permease protein